MKGDQPLFFDVLNDKNFRDLLRNSQRRAIPWEELLEHSLPVGLSPNQTNKVLESFGRCLGVHLFEDIHGDLLWYRRTYELEQLVASIGSLNASIKVFLANNSHVFTPAYQNELLHKEAHAALEFAQRYYSGSTFKFTKTNNYSEANYQSKLNQRNGAYRSSLQQTEAANVLVESFLTLHCSVTATSYSLTRSTLESFAAQLLAGLCCEDKTLVSSFENKNHLALRNTIFVPYFDASEEEQLRYQRFLDDLCSYGTSNDNHDDLPLLKGSLIGFKIMQQSAFGILTPFLASLATHLAYMQMNENILAYLPLLPAFLAWRKEEIGNFCVQSFSSYSLTAAQTPSDATLFQTVNAQCILFTLKKIYEHLMRHTKQAEILSQNLDGLQNLNIRQRKALISLVDKNTAFITIKDYQQRYKTSYATARRDLLALEEQSLLESYFERKALAFKASSKLLAFATT